ncbi:AGC protein kinase Gad8 [Mortierella sp. GBA43]|nr:AGC protein kinase Gad8 [Mortierella sp. GBA43]
MTSLNWLKKNKDNKEREQRDRDALAAAAHAKDRERERDALALSQTFNAALQIRSSPPSPSKSSPAPAGYQYQNQPSQYSTQQYHHHPSQQQHHYHYPQQQHQNQHSPQTHYPYQQHPYPYSSQQQHHQHQNQHQQQYNHHHSHQPPQPLLPAVQHYSHTSNGYNSGSVAGTSISTTNSTTTSASASTASISTHTGISNGASALNNQSNGASSAPASPQTLHQSQGQKVGGLLAIRLVEARDLTLPPLSYQPFTPQNQKNQTNKSAKAITRKWWLPYAVLEFDRNEVLIDALGGELSKPVWQYRAHFDVSRETQVQLSFYIRIPDPKAMSVDSKDSRDCPYANQDIFLGYLRLQPQWDEPMQDDWFSLQGGHGQVRVQLLFRRRGGNVPLTIDSFDLLKVIGKGSFGKVMQVRKRDTSRIYAMKILRKAHIISRSEVNHTLAERTVLAQINNPFIVPLKFSFQSPEKLYLVLAFVNGGELFHHLQREGRFSEERSRFYAAELLCALECLHSYNVVYRDLKPENILLDYTGHIALCDFGLCKLGMTESETTNTFCGTPEYLAPELLLGQGYTKTVDWWTLGVLLFEMLTGLPPYYDENIHDMYRKILQDELRFPDEISPVARSLLTALLTRDPANRLGNGSNGSTAIKQHAFFEPISFQLLMAKKIQPPFKPSVSSATDTSNFDEEFTSEEPLDSVADDSPLSETVQLQFKGFTYNPTQDHLLGTSAGGGAGGLSTTVTAVRTN